MSLPLAITTGRRKTAVAQISLFPGTGAIRINGLVAEDYLSASPALLLAVQAPLRAILPGTRTFDVQVRVSGGGLTGQAEAIQLGLARALTVVNEENRLPLRTQTLLTRDAREKERRKYGLKKARKAPQFSKR
jgi:small subunit ribosomal protein S9